MNKIERVAVIGAGTMGQGIAANALFCGKDVYLVDPNESVLQASLGRIEQKASKQGKDCERLHVFRSVSDLPIVDLAVEAVFEEETLKKSVLAEISKRVSEEGLIATNTSAIRIQTLAEAVADPSRFLGLHYFSPADRAPTVEVVAGERTSPASMHLAQSYLHETGKSSLICKDSPGFAINRFFCPFLNAAADLLGQNVATAGEIDLVARALLRSPAGPFEVMNLIKPVIVLNAMRTLSQLGAGYAASQSLLDQAGLGRPWEILSAAQAPATAPLIETKLAQAVIDPLTELRREKVAKLSDIDLAAQETLLWGVRPTTLLTLFPQLQVS